MDEALNESRILILGTQTILGLLYSSTFEPGYDNLGPLSEYFVLAALAFTILAFIVLTSPVAYHRIVDRGRDRPDFQAFAIALMKPALPLVGMAMALTIYVASQKITGPAAAGVIAGVSAGTGWIIWHGFRITPKARGKKRASARSKSSPPRSQSKGRPTPLSDKIKHVLIEARMVLPGAQALLGFQFITMLLSDFDKLPQSSKLVHLLSLLMTSISITLLMTPAARHRIVEKGEDSEEFHKFASRLVLIAMAPLALGIAGDFFVVVAKVTTSVALGACGAGLALATSYGMWFGFTLYRRCKVSHH